MPYAIYKQNYITPQWHRFSTPTFAPSLGAWILKHLGFPGRWKREEAELQRSGTIDPAQEDINAWIKKWHLPADTFKDRPEHMYLPCTLKRVSEIYNSRDECAAILDLKFSNSDARNSSEWGSSYIHSVLDNSMYSSAVAYTYNEFTLEEV